MSSDVNEAAPAALPPESASMPATPSAVSTLPNDSAPTGAAIETEAAVADAATAATEVAVSPSEGPLAGRIKIGSQREGIELEKPRPDGPVEVPNLRAPLGDELEAEMAAALETTVEALMDASAATIGEGELAPESRREATVAVIHGDNVFFDLGAQHQGVIPSKQFTKLPEIGSKLEVTIASFEAEDGLYRLSVPGAATPVGNWSQVQEGMIVEARVTGTNKGGLECDVSNLRGFIPASQASLYRVEDLAQFVGQKLDCLVTEVNPRKRKLVVSRRAVLEREKEQSREQLITALAAGQIREGIVRDVRDFGAFIDLGGVDGLLHVSQLSWTRVNHPNELLQPGQSITVKITKIDPASRKISLSLKELMESPWVKAASNYAIGSIVKGQVSKIMDFGAFVRLEPGVEGLVHISELAHRRVNRVNEVLSEGAEVEAKVLSVDPGNQRISLSIKATQARPEPEKRQREPEPEPLPPRKQPKNLRGGVGKQTGGEAFGLRW